MGRFCLGLSLFKVLVRIGVYLAVRVGVCVLVLATHKAPKYLL